MFSKQGQKKETKRFGRRESEDHGDPLYARVKAGRSENPGHCTLGNLVMVGRFKGM